MALILKFLLMNFYFQIDWFVIRLARKYDRPGKKLLDVGAGECKYKKHFKKLVYKSQDVKQNTYKTIDYVGEVKGLIIKAGGENIKIYPCWIGILCLSLGIERFPKCLNNYCHFWLIKFTKI